VPTYVFHKKHRILNSKEMQMAKNLLVEHMTQQNEINERKKKSLKEFERELKPHIIAMPDLMKMITSGVDEGEANCKVEVDAFERKVRFYKVTKETDPDTNKREEILTLFDTQSFDDVGEKQLTMWEEAEAKDALANN
jgi:hypothetical protein